MLSMLKFLMWSRIRVLDTGASSIFRPSSFQICALRISSWNVCAVFQFGPHFRRLWLSMKPSPFRWTAPSNEKSSYPLVRKRSFIAGLACKAIHSAHLGLKKGFLIFSIVQHLVASISWSWKERPLNLSSEDESMIWRLTHAYWYVVPQEVQSKLFRLILLAISLVSGPQPMH